MRALFSKTMNTFFGRHLEFRVRLFNLLAWSGLTLCVTSSINGFFINAGIYNLMASITVAGLTVLLLWYSLKSGNYQRCYTLTVIGIFLGLYPFYFFNSGGYYGGMPLHFIFALLFTVTMMTGKKMIAFIIVEMLFYTALYMYAYFYPENIRYFDTEANMLSDMVFSFLLCGLVLSVTFALHFRLYEQTLRELEDARRQAEEYAKMKGELFAGMSHEMRTPLTVMSAYAQFAVEQIRVNGANEQTLTDLFTISEESQRLAEMADGILKILLISSEQGEAAKRVATPVNIRDLTNRLAYLLEPIAARKGQKLTVTIEDGLPEISGDADGLTQLFWNVIQNAFTHSRGKIELYVQKAEEGGVLCMIKDDGEGISPDLLPRVFERGVSGEKGGSGIGLSICRDIARQHGGDMSIQSEYGTGTCVSIILKGSGGL